MTVTCNRTRCWGCGFLKSWTEDDSHMNRTRCWGCGFLKSWTEDESHMQQDTLLGVWLLEELDRG